MKVQNVHACMLVWLLVTLVAIPSGVLAQTAGTTATFKQEELDQLLAPIALYPDALLAQILMASTYPLEVIQAARWAKANPNLKGTQLENALLQQPWDPSVKSLAAFPQVLTMMSEKLDWTQKLGDAFLARQKDVMDTVQKLRAKAQAQGNLKTTREQTVIVEQQPAQTIIKIEPANPQVIYVPTYNPVVVYGTWWWPTYPPYYYYPPGYVAAASVFWFGAGTAVGAALWGGCDWHHGDININVNRFNGFNRTTIQNNKWEHNSIHRKGVAYRDQVTQQRFGRGSQAGVGTREAFRGRAEPGRQELRQGGLEQRRDAGGLNGARVGSQRDAGGAFEGYGRGSEVSNFSERGSQSLSSFQRASGNVGGGGRAGGGGSRGGGGRR